jgi:1,4-dihydroxy-2-naphthoate octaprenyltransferase
MGTELRHGSRENELKPSFSASLHLAGYQFLTFSLLPAIVGITLPFWLNAGEFIYGWASVFQFLAVMLLFHSGFALLNSGFERPDETVKKKRSLFIAGIVCLIGAVLGGIHLNNHLSFGPDVHPRIFLLYLGTCLFIGLLYVIPPIRFAKQIGGEMIFSVGLGMMPVIGGYLVMMGDLHRTTYLAAFPIVVSTGLWIWLANLINRRDDENKGYKTTVMLFSESFSARYGTLALAILVYATLLLAVFGKPALNPFSLVLYLSIFLAWRIVVTTWNQFDNMETMKNNLRYACYLHVIVCLIIAATSLMTVLGT